jgi:hypothetical protein
MMPAAPSRHVEHGAGSTTPARHRLGSLWTMAGFGCEQRMFFSRPETGYRCSQL